MTNTMLAYFLVTQWSVYIYIIVVVTFIGFIYLFCVWKVWNWELQVAKFKIKQKTFKIINILCALKKKIVA